LTPGVRRDVLIDNAAFRLSSSLVRLPEPNEVDRVIEETAEAVNLFEARGFLARPESYHVTPPTPAISARRARSGTIRYSAWKWDDRFSVRPEEPGAGRFASYDRNRFARAAVLQHRGGDRPWLVLVHGWGMGNPALDLRSFRVLHLHRDLGLNLASVTLPLHGRRKPERAGLMPPVPGPDMLDNVHGLAQAAWDVRQVLAHIRSTTSQPVGLMGLSLGGHTVALVAALDGDVACAIAIVPAVDLPALMTEHRDRVKKGADIAADITMMARVLTPVAPLALPARVPSDRCLIVAATLDRFAPVSSQAIALAAHWGNADIHWFHGGHVGAVWAAGVKGAIDDALARFGFVR
jgi:hypothetical protein